MAGVLESRGGEIVREAGGGPINGVAAATTTAGERISTGGRTPLGRHRPKPSIYRVPAWIRDLNSSAYTPQFVSFGPYHHGVGDHLKPMEEHKCTARSRFLRRANKTLDEIKRSVEDSVEDIMDSYQGLDEKWRNNREGFLDLMILDGCFMLEVLLFHYGYYHDDVSALNRTRRRRRTTTDGYSKVDDHPVFGKKLGAYMMPYIRRDMLLIENQLPLELLERLAKTACYGGWGHECNVQEMVLEFLASSGEPLLLESGPLQMALTTPSIAEIVLLVPRLYAKLLMDILLAPFRLICGPRFLQNSHRIHLLNLFRFAPVRRQEKLNKIRAQEGHHVLDVYKKSMLLHWSSCGGQVPFSAKELTRFGVRFRGARTGSLRGIDFNLRRLRFEAPHLLLLLIPKPILTLPVLKVDDHTLPTFLNLMAFERLHHGTGDEVNNYLLLMCSMVRSVEDVKALFNDRIVVCGPGKCDEAIYKVFAELVEQALPTALEASGRTKLYSEVAAYCGSPAGRTIRRLRQAKPPPSVVMFLSILAIAVSLFAAFSNQIFQKTG